MDDTKKLKLNASSLRAYVMVAVLAVMWLLFHWITPGNTFLTPGNLSNLFTQMSVTGILAVGMLMLIVSGNIDLSVGSVLGLAGGVAAWAVMSGYSLPIAMGMAIAICIGVGLFHGTLTAYLNIPAFIVTLGGLLAWRGVVKWLLGGSTIPITDPTFKALGQSYIGTTFGWILAAVAVGFLVFMAMKRAQSSKRYGLGEANYGSELLKSILPAIAIVTFIWVMNSYEDQGVYKGVPTPVLILVAIALLGGFLTTSTTFGRYLYAIGGNADAARLSGINNKRNVVTVYAILGAVTGLAALIHAGRLGSATPDAGVLKELDAIAACVIGGASLMGGRGTIFGACLGALIMASLDNGMSLYGVRDFLQDIVKGSILVAAVGLDMFGRKQG